jgi:hypothetical protein
MHAERFIVSQIVVLQRSREVKKAKDARKQLTWRMDAWQQGSRANSPGSFKILNEQWKV